jgi:uncharacterized protein with ParB-like and HNH nuclease domain
VVPLFQRPSVWSPDQWEQLWTDIWEQYQIRGGTGVKKTARFLGSIVVVREYEKNLDKFTVIDGQQRITTISILLAVIRAFARERGMNELYGQISDFLRNTPKTGEGQYVIIPTGWTNPHCITFLTRIIPLNRIPGSLNALIISGARLTVPGNRS